MLKKLLAAYTVICFMLSSLAAPAADGVQVRARHTRRAAQVAAALDVPGACALVIPTMLGRITGSYSSVPLSVSPSALELPDTVIIQDLHCHPEAQRKIAGIIDAIGDAAGGPAGMRVFVEGASGMVDTSWIMAIEDAPLRERVRDALMESGRLTGAEYWAMRQPAIDGGRAAAAPSAPSPLLWGLEDTTLHRDNIVRLAGLMAHRQQDERLLQGMARDLASLRNACLSPRNRRFHRILERYAAGDMPSVRYFTLLRAYVQNINEHPERYGSVLPVRWRAYPTIETFLQAHALQKRLNHKRAVAQMGVLIGTLKERLPYGVYEDLRRRSNNFGRMDVLVPAIGNLFEEYQLDKAGDFAELKQLFACQTMQQSINPLQLLQEERHLVEALRVALADDVAEVEVAFLSDFLSFFARYIRHSLTPDEHEYFRARFATFRALWGTYFIHNDILDCADEIGALDTYFAVNEQRTAVFLDALAAAQRSGPVRGRIVNIVVTGGYHAEGLARGLEARRSSYIVITPNITTETTTAGRVYSAIIGEQARLFASQALAALPSSASAHIVSIQHDRVVISINKRTFTFTIRDGKFLEPSVAAQGRARSPAGMAEAVRRTVNMFMREGMRTDDDALSSVAQSFAATPQRDIVINHMNPLVGAVTVAVAVSRIALLEGTEEGWWEPGGIIWELFSDPGLVTRLHASDEHLRVDTLQRMPAWWQKHIVSRAALSTALTEKKQHHLVVIALDQALNHNLHLLLPSQQPSLTFTGTRLVLGRLFSHGWLRRHMVQVEYIVAPIMEAPVFLVLAFAKGIRWNKAAAYITRKLYAANPDMSRELVEQGINGVVRWITVGVVVGMATGLLMSVLLPQGAVMLVLSASAVPVFSSDVFSHIFYNVVFRHARLTSWLIGRMVRQSDQQRDREIKNLAGTIAALPAGRQIVFLTGPSASGKTTTTKELIKAAHLQGRRVVRLSLDEYYRLRSGGEEDGYDRRADGSLNFDTPAALHWDLVAADITALMLGYRVAVPRYERRGEQSKRVPGSVEQLGENDILLVEGIFALTDEMQHALRQGGPQLGKHILRCAHEYAGTASAAKYDPQLLRMMTDEPDGPWYDTVKKIFDTALDDTDLTKNHRIFIELHAPFENFSDDDLRLMRRLIRDSMDTGNADATIAATINRYDSVIQGAAAFVIPSRERAHWRLNTYRTGEVFFWTELLRATLQEAYEQAVIKRTANPTDEVTQKEPEKIHDLLVKLEHVPGVTQGTMREFYGRVSNSVLREFAGEEFPARRQVGYWVSSVKDTANPAVPAGYAPVRVRPMPAAAYAPSGKSGLRNLNIAGNKVWLSEGEDVPTLYVVARDDADFKARVTDIITAIHGSGVVQGRKRPLRMLRAYFEKRGIALDAAKAIVFWDGQGGDMDALGDIPVYPAAAVSYSAPALLNARVAEMAARRPEIGFIVPDPGVLLDAAHQRARYDNQVIFVSPATLDNLDMQGQVKELKDRGAKVILLCESDTDVTEELKNRMTLCGIDHVVIMDGDPLQFSQTRGSDLVVEGGNTDSWAAGHVRSFVDVKESADVPTSSVPLIVKVTLPTNDDARVKLIQQLNTLPVGTMLVFDASALTGISDGGMDLSQYGVNLFGSFFGTVTRETRDLYQRTVARRLATLSFDTGVSGDDLNTELQSLLVMIRNTDSRVDREHPNAAYAEAARVHLTKTTGAARDAFMRAAEQYLRMRYFLARQGKPLGMADQDAEDLMEKCFTVGGVDVTVLLPTLTQNSVVDAFRNTHKDEQIEVYVRAFKREIMGQARQLITQHNEQHDPQALRNALELLSLLDGKIVMPTARPDAVNLQAIYTILSAA